MGRPVGRRTATGWVRASATVRKVQYWLLLGALGCGTTGTTSPTDTTVATVEVTPAATTLTAFGAMQQLTAVARNAAGEPISGQTFSWTSSNSNVVTVSGTGLAAAVSDGSVTVTATAGGVEGTAAVTVMQTVSTVAVTPGAPSINVGDTVRLTASPQDANGNAVPGTPAATWTTSDTAVATVDQTGLVTGVAAGSAMVTAAVGSDQGSATVTVGMPGPAPTIFFEEGFEDGNFASRGWYDLPGGGLSLTTAEKVSGASSLEVLFNQSSSTPAFGAGARHLFTATESVYLSYWVKYSANWVGSGANFHPHEFYIMTDVDGSFIGPSTTHLTAYVEHNYQGGGIPLLGIQDALNIDQGNINVDLTGVTENRAVAGCNGDSDGYTGDCFSVGVNQYSNFKIWQTAQPYFEDTPGARYKNDWHFIEALFQLNTIQGGVGIADGMVQYWYDGQLIIDHRDVLLRTGAHPTMAFNQLLFAPFIGPGSPVTQTMWVDDLRVGDGRP